MSAWIIEDESINNLVKFFIKCSYSQDEFKSFINRLIEEQGYFLNFELDDTNPNAEKLGRDLKILNRRAYKQRYDKDFNDVKFILNNKEENNLFQILKNLQCFLYQCCEGDTDKQPLYKTLRKIEQCIESHIVGDLEEYKKADWK